jgi:hypothetical protein
MHVLSNYFRLGVSNYFQLGLSNYFQMAVSNYFRGKWMKRAIKLIKVHFLDKVDT